MSSSSSPPDEDDNEEAKDPQPDSSSSSVPQIRVETDNETEQQTGEQELSETTKVNPVNTTNPNAPASAEEEIPPPPPPVPNTDEHAAAAMDESERSDEDVASKAAVALAAVAAAAVANNKSPIAAAKEARDLAQTFIHSAPTTVETQLSSTPFQTVSLAAVKTHLRQRSLETGSSVADKLGQGDNDSFLQHLLLLRGYVCDERQAAANPSDAAAQVDALLQRIEAAYDALSEMLPPNHTNDETIVPDLLPPCTSPEGDVTLSFFRACMGESSTSSSTSPTATADGGSSTFSPAPTATAVPSTAEISPATSTKSVFSMFKKMRKKTTTPAAADAPTPMASNENLQPGEYRVQIDREMLGLTVENVLERTVVRTIVPGGPAKKAGARVGSLIVQVGNQETKHLTHFETIDELRQSNRPLLLVLRQISEDALRSAREEMGRLIQGAGFGSPRPDPRLDSYSKFLHQRLWNSTTASKKEESVDMVGEKLVWILTLMVIGMERERQDVSDVAKSISKTLLEYTLHKVLPKPPPPPPPPPRRAPQAQQQQQQQQQQQSKQQQANRHDLPLVQIGDVLQRTRNFLADPRSPSAALIRGELIAFLCDLLDLDTEMELMDEQEVNDNLGSAGSLLKLIVLNCPLMKSPCCAEQESEAASSSAEGQLDESDEAVQRFGKDNAPSDRHALHAGNRFLAIVHRLAASRSTSARIAACSLGPVLWGHLDFPHQLQLRGVITRALHDVEVLVRKSTATVLHEIAELVFDARSVPWLVLMCERAMTDPEPQLRAAAMTLTWHLAEHLPNAFFGDARQGSRYLCRLPDREDPLFADVYLLQCKLLPVATRLAEDRSPSVRLAVAAQSDRLCDALGDHWSSVIIDVLLGLLSDADERVRCEAVSCVPRLSEIVLLSTKPGERSPSEVSILEALLPAAIKLQKDASVAVRVTLATAAGELLTLLVALQTRQDRPVDYKRHTDDRLIPMVQNLLNDPDPEVTSAGLRAVTNATRQRKRHMSVASTDGGGADDISLSSATTEPVVVPVLSEEQVLRLLPTLTELSDSKQWRVRQSAVEIVPALVGCTTESETRMAISQLCVKLLADSVDAVRTTAAECLCMGIKDDSAWMEVVTQTIQSCSEHQNAKQRLLSLKMIPTAIVHGGASADLVQTALSLRQDAIANVRLNVGRSLESVLFQLDETTTKAVVDGLQEQFEMESNTFRDADVLYFCKRCMKKAEGTLRSGLASPSAAL